MRLGLIADIHGNLPALRAVLDELERLKAELVLCAGDLVAYGAFPNQVIALLRQQAVPCVLGNYDQAAAWDLSTASSRPSSLRTEPLKRAALAWTQQQLDQDNRRYLRGLPWQTQYRFDQQTYRLLHAGPEKLDESYSPQDQAGLWQLAASLRADVVVLGHTHQPFAQQVGNTLFINPGAVGRSLDGDPRASFALLETQSMRLEFFRISYDLEAAVQAVLNSGMPREIATLLRFGLRRIEDAPQEVRVAHGVGDAVVEDLE
jgi:putative phosphoesterase